jgi:hypothetical protein
MSILGSQLEIDMDPEGEATVIPLHTGNTGTGCYKMHDHTIRDTKRAVTIPAADKLESTYMYAPTPPPPPEEEEEEGNGSEDKGDGEGDGGDGPDDGASGAGQATRSRANSVSTKGGKSASSDTSSSASGGGAGPNVPTPHLLDAPVQPVQQDQINQLTPAVTTGRRKELKSQKSASIGVSE